MTVTSIIQGARALPTLPSAPQRHWLGAIVSEQLSQDEVLSLSRYSRRQLLANAAIAASRVAS
jgi:hypothetical protein